MLKFTLFTLCDAGPSADEERVTSEDGDGDWAASGAAGERR